MYLLCLLVVLPSIITIIPIRADCGCAVNRNNEGQCNKNDEHPSHKYTKDANTPPTDNKPAFNTDNMVYIEGGAFEMGTNEPHFPTDFEGPLRNVTLKTFYLDKYEVSNQNFMEFVSETGYKTEAETFGDSFIFEMQVPEEEREKHDDFRAVQAPWWIKMKGVTWEHPEGPKTSIDDRLDHPVIHVSWTDAKKYCEHLGKRLPSEAEWEMACRGGLRQKLYPWGNKLTPKNMHWTNIWQGDFPNTNTAEDGFLFTAPVHHFPANKFGLHNMAGNVWEWTQDSWTGSDDLKVKKGGSYLCHKSYCYRYRCAARSHNTKDTSAGNLGFRCAGDAL